ncbi:hypothetical protein KP509_10G046800 [Ceratopteris richardii]|uniref:CSC1-like protein ERD4 n=1 Tax=Ceratopteris richardii TaxID=49495 RepID=A0A8T2U1L5_CERRI|nr:hypothetical protein KP509_10G046800 [Ceratopteris richardii]
MDISGFVTSIITSLSIFFVLLVLHAWLSRQSRNAVIYYPSKLLKGIAPPPQQGFFPWVREAWSVSDDQILQHAGLDATVYMIFLSSAFWICMYTAFFCLPVLLPLSVTDRYFESNSKADFTNFDKAAMGNIAQKSPRLWAFAIADYWLTICTLFVLWKSYKRVMDLRLRDQASFKAKPEHFAVLVRDIPMVSIGSVEEEVDRFFRRLHPTTYETCIVVSNVSEARKLWAELESYRRRLAHAEAVYDQTNIRPKHKSGLLGLLGQTVDSIDYYKEQIERLIPVLRVAQSEVRLKHQQGAAIVIFNSRSAAAMAAQALHSEHGNHWMTMPAPEPGDVMWDNLPIAFVQRTIRQLAVYIFVAITILFYMIPIALISALISLENLEKRLKFLKPITQQPEIRTVLQAFLPQIALIVFLALLPMMLLKLSQFEGIPARSHITRAAAGKYFYFNVFNVFLGVTLAGTLFQSLNSLIKDPTSIVSLLSESLPKQATFFISFIALKFLVGYGLQLSRIIPLIIFHLRKKFLCKTEEEIKDAWAPGAFPYATCIPSDMLILTITICYAVLAPAILPFTIIYFGLGWILMRNQALNVMVSKFESGGRFWPHLHARILAALLLAQVTMLGYFGIKKFLFVPLIIPPPIATLIFAFLCKKSYYRSFSVSPLVASCEDVKEVPSTESIVKAYMPECLIPKRDFIGKSDFENQEES